ncbi:hypothetical protein D3C84_499780 [compost metagenome]
MNERNTIDRRPVLLADCQRVEIGDASLTQVDLVDALAKSTHSVLVVRYAFLLRHDKYVGCLPIVAIYLTRQ